MPTPLDPIAAAIHAEVMTDALKETGAYVTRRWQELPKGTQLTMGGALIAFRKMSTQEQELFVALLYQKATVLAIERAEQIANAHASPAGIAVKPAA